jgi:hypothetical protein
MVDGIGHNSTQCMRSNKVHCQQGVVRDLHTANGICSAQPIDSSNGVPSEAATSARAEQQQQRVDIESVQR